MDKSQKKILIIEDEIFIIELYEHVLTKEGYKVSMATNGEEALNQIKSNPDLDLILLDILLPKLNGIELLRKIKSDNETKHIKVVLLSNLAQESIISEAFKIGAFGYIRKSSINPYQLSDTIYKILSDPNYKMEQEAKRVT